MRHIMKDSKNSRCLERKRKAREFSEKIPVDPAGDRCYEGSAKPCKSSRKRGEMLSNTSIIYPEVRDTHGKLWLIPDRRNVLG